MVSEQERHIRELLKVTDSLFGVLNRLLGDTKLLVDALPPGRPIPGLDVVTPVSVVPVDRADQERRAAYDRACKRADQFAVLLAKRWFGLDRPTEPQRVLASRLFKSVRGSSLFVLARDFAFDDAVSVVELVPKPSLAVAMSTFQKRKGRVTKVCLSAMALLGYTADQQSVADPSLDSRATVPGISES